MRSCTVLLAIWVASGHSFFLGNLFKKPKRPTFEYQQPYEFHRPSYAQPGLFKPSLPIKDWSPQHGQYGTSFASTSPSTDDKPMYIYQRPKPKPKPILPAIKLPPFDILRHFLSKIGLLRSHFLGKLSFLGGIFRKPKRVKPSYFPKPSYKPRPNRPAPKPTTLPPLTYPPPAEPTRPTQPPFYVPDNSYGAPSGPLLPTKGTPSPPLEATTTPAYSYGTPWQNILPLRTSTPAPPPPRPPSSSYVTSWDNYFTQELWRPPSTTAYSTTWRPPSTTAYSSTWRPPSTTSYRPPWQYYPPGPAKPPTDSYGVPLAPPLTLRPVTQAPVVTQVPLVTPSPTLEDSYGAPWAPPLTARPPGQTSNQDSIFYNQIRPRFPTDQRPETRPETAFFNGSSTSSVEQPRPLQNGYRDLDDIMNEIIRPLDGYGAPLDNLLSAGPSVQAARAVLPQQDNKGSELLLVGTKSSQPGRGDEDARPEPEVPNGFQSSHTQWKPMEGPHVRRQGGPVPKEVDGGRSMKIEEVEGGVRSMRMENTSDNCTSGAVIQVVDGDPVQELKEWVLQPDLSTNSSTTKAPRIINSSYQPDKESSGAGEQLHPPTALGGEEWDVKEEATTEAVEPAFVNLRNLADQENFVEDPVDEAMKDTLYTIFLQIMNKTQAISPETTTKNIVRRPESISDIISFIRNVTNNADSTQGINMNMLEKLQELSLAEGHSTNAELTTAITTKAKDKQDKATARPRLITGRGINGFITGIVHLRDDAKFLYDPKTGTLVSKKKMTNGFIM